MGLLLFLAQTHRASKLVWTALESAASICDSIVRRHCIGLRQAPSLARSAITRGRA